MALSCKRGLRRQIAFTAEPKARKNGRYGLRGDEATPQPIPEAWKDSAPIKGLSRHKRGLLQAPSTALGRIYSTVPLTVERLLGV
jgi:hypothetical protein